MQIKCSSNASLWRAGFTSRPFVKVLIRSVALAGIIEIARAMARRAAREDHARAVEGRGD